MDEGLFAKEGLDVELVAHGGRTETNVNITDWNKVHSNAGHAEAMERGMRQYLQRLRMGQLPAIARHRGRCRQVGRRASIVAWRRCRAADLRHLHASTTCQ